MGLSNEDKKDIKEIFVDALEPFAKAMQEDIQRLDKKIDRRFDELDIKLGDDAVYNKGRFDVVERRLTKVEERVG